MVPIAAQDGVFGIVRGAASSPWPRAPRLWWDVVLAERQGAVGLSRRAQARLRALVRFARTASPLYRELYRDLPDEVVLGDLPPVSKPRLMADFDDWVTDPRVTRSRLEAFTADPERVGEPYGHQAFVCTSSGTTGRPGLFVHDRRAVAVYQALIVLRCYPSWLTPAVRAHMLRHGIRAALLTATGGHYAGAAWYTRARRSSRIASRVFRIFPVQTPLDELVAALDDFAPTVLAGYPSALTLLAGERAAGRLHVAPVLAATAGEVLSDASRAHLADALGCPVRDSYASSEALFFAFDCPAGWLHLSSDWVILEPVGSDLRPTPPGVFSHTVLLTNLANRVQPIIRYDLGDSVRLRADPCPCGNRLPALQVRGRSDDVLRLTAADGRRVDVLPMAIGAVAESVRGAGRTQLVRTGPGTLRVRLEADPGTRPDQVWPELLAALHRYLAAQGLASVELVRAEEPPQTGPGGKFRQVIAPAEPAPG